MSQDESGSASTGCLIAVVVVVLLVVCGGGALALAGALLFFRLSAQSVPAAPVPPVQVAHADVLSIEADGTLVWNGEPVLKAELTGRLDVLKNAAGPPRSVIVRADQNAPPVASEEVFRMLSDRGVAYLVEDGP